jgi:hypothetical protein
MKKRIIVVSALIALIGATFGTAALAKGKAEGPKSLGKVTLDTEVGWTIGSGQFDGEFITAEKQGIVIGLRAQERFVGTLDVSGTKGNRVGVYHADTGSTGGDNNGTWNYDWSVDLSGAKGTTLSDYSLTLEQDFTSESLFGILGSDPVVLPMPDVCDSPTATLCQQSWNAGFGNGDYDPFAEGTYTLRLVLTPETFNGPSIAVVIKVVASDA